jgi:acetyl-CoA acyltransferase
MSDAFICDYVRTPIGRYGGVLAAMRSDDLAAVPISELLRRHASLSPDAIDGVLLGCVNQSGEDSRNVARMALLLAGLPVSVPGSTINRLCGSGMDAVASAARAIRCDEAEVMIAGGVESMSRAPFVIPKAEAAFSRSARIHDSTTGYQFVNPRFDALYGNDSMPATAENVAEIHGISRPDQDAFAMRSHKRTVAAQVSGRLAREIATVNVPMPKGEARAVTADEHPRPDTSMEKLGRLPAPFRKAGGTVTAGNSSGVNDGAAAMIIASEAGARRHGLEPIARIVGGAESGIEPRIMGMGPVPAVRKLCSRLGLALADFDVIELNEAFAAQGIAVLRALGIAEDADMVNPNGGAIALGHPLGMSGSRITGTAALQLKLHGGKRALATMCIGFGQGIAVALERV